MNKRDIKQKVQKILIQIHRGFLTEEVSKTVTDAEILSYVPPNSTSSVPVEHDSEDMIRKLTPFTEKWVRKQVKKNPDVTALEMLKSAGFVDA